MNQLWILTEEKPKPETVSRVIEIATGLTRGSVDENRIKVIPVLDDHGRFTFVYNVTGAEAVIHEPIFLTIVSGYSSFVDYLVFYSQGPPDPRDQPLFGIEETKTDDAESRNTAVYQRSTKFVYMPFYYPEARKVMLYTFQVPEKTVSTETNIFGTRCLRTIGVEIVGKAATTPEPFTTLEDLIDAKDAMKKPPSGNTPLSLAIRSGVLQISAKLEKSGGFGNDPNMGATALLAAASRSLGWNGPIEVVNHGLTQSMVKANKWVKIANKLEIGLSGIQVPSAKLPDAYWRYEHQGEKVGTIFLHAALDLSNRAKVIYDNHAGCERGYFWSGDGQPIALPKQISALDEDGKKRKFPLPDLIFVEPDRKIVVSVEGEKSDNYEAGEEQLRGFQVVEESYIRPNYREFSHERWVTTFGDTDSPKGKHAFELGSAGDIRVYDNCPAAISEAMLELRSWQLPPHIVSAATAFARNHVGS